MSARLLLEVAVRVLGLWLVCSAVGGLAAVVYGLPGIMNLVGGYPLIESLIPVIVQSVLGVMLTWFAPWIAAWFYPTDRDHERVDLRLGPGDLYRVACFVLGAWILVQAAEPAIRLAVVGRLDLRLSAVVADAVRTLVYLAAGIFLVFGSRPIAAFLSNLRYDPDTIPKQQISLAVLMALIFVVCLVLGAVRWAIQRGS